MGCLHPGWKHAYVKLLPQTHTQYALCWMFLLHIQAEMMPAGSRPTNQCPVCSLWDVSLTHPRWNGAYGNISHKPVPSMLLTGCFTYTSRLKWCLWQTSPYKPILSTFPAGCLSYTSRLKWCLQELHPQTSAQYAIYRMFLLHIQAKMLPMANISHKTMPRILWDVSLAHPDSYGASRELSQTHAHHNIY